MSIPILWLIFTSTAIVGMVGYDVAIKLATEQINVFAFTTILVGFAFAMHLLALLVYKVTVPDASLSLNTKTIGWAALGGLGLVVMDIGFYLGVKYGGLAMTNAVWLIGGLILSVILGYYAFHEPIDIKKIIGVAFGLLAIYLMVV